VSVDLSRPPARLPPRLTDYTVVGVSWLVFFLLSLSLHVLGNPDASSGSFFLSGIIVLTALGLALYLSIRIGWRALFYSWMTNLSKYPPVAGVEMDGRSADQEELNARKLFKKGRISRVDYERRIAYRRFVHGEITRTEYRQLLGEIETAREATPASRP